MHKLSKGLKKKIKGKKGKDKEDDLFDPAILEQYRRDKAAAAAAAAAAAEDSEHPANDEEEGSPGSPEAAGAVAASPATEKPESEEWLKFKLLTSGVDSILQKTQEDLGRIKKTSYFQRNKKAETPTPGEEAKPIVASGAPTADAVQTPSKGRWIGFEEGAIDDPEAEQNERNPDNGKENKEVAEEPEVVPEVEEEEPAVEDEDIFNTEYIDALTSGELKLAYVPDSPTDEKPEDDPFDTSVVEKIVGPLPVIKKKRQLVSIGAAAEILTVVNEQKRTQPSDPNRQRSRQPPSEIQLLCCFDDEDGQQQSLAGSKANTPFDRPATSAQPSPLKEAAESSLPPAEPVLKDILAEFDVIPETGDPVDVEDFIVKPAAPAVPLVPVPEPELADEEDFEFEALAYQSLAKNPQPILPEQEDGDDPFDTSCVEKVLAKDLSAPTAPAESSVAPAKKSATTAPPPPRPAPPSRPSRPRAPPSKVSLAAAAAALIDPAPTQKPAGTIVDPAPAAQLQPQDSFEALFLSDDPVPSSVPAPVSPVPAQVAGQDPLETTAVEELSDDPFDTSVADRLVAGLTLPQSSATPLPESDPSTEATAPATSFTFLGDEAAEEDDPFDTSAVEKILL